MTLLTPLRQSVPVPLRQSVRAALRPAHTLSRWREQAYQAAQIRAIRPYSMLSDWRLASLLEETEAILDRGTPGALVECGVWRGGASFLMARELQRRRIRDRLVWMFDSYEGLPDPGPSDGTRAQGFRTLPAAETFDNCTASLADVEAGARTLGVRHLVRPVKGWFADTLPLHRDQIGPIALLRLDGDWYESTKTCLDTLASAVVPGGLIVVDDYYDWEGCRVAVHEWIAARRFSAAITLCWPRHQWPGTPCVAIRIPGA